jgi:hypothetical protein
MDQKDMFAFFLTLRKQYSEDEIPRLLETYEITKLDINRIYRYLDKYLLNSAESDSKRNSVLNPNEINSGIDNDNDNCIYSAMNINPDNSNNDNSDNNDDD